MTEREGSIPGFVRLRIAELVRDLAAGEYDALVGDGRAGRLTAEELREAVGGYPATLIPLPDDAFDVGGDAYLVDGTDPPEWAIDQNLWTREEGRSDLTLQLDVRFPTASTDWRSPISMSCSNSPASGRHSRALAHHGVLLLDELPGFRAFGRVQVEKLPSPRAARAGRHRARSARFCVRGEGGGAIRNVWVVRSDGFGVRQVTDGRWHGSADWSSDGERVVTDTDPGVVELGVDGRGRRVLLEGEYGGPSWSPDGEDLLVVAGSGIGLGLAEGGQPPIEPVDTPAAHSPEWSPDGSWVAFVDGENEADLWIVRPNGTGLRQLTTLRTS